MSKYAGSVLITGCSIGGIGHALALEYHAKGLRVFATSRQLESMAELRGLGITTFELDVCDPETIQKVKAQVMEMNEGKLDILVNNAGKSYTLPATDYDIAKVKKLFDVNLFGVMSMCQAFIPLLMNSNPPIGPKIVNIGSIAAIMPGPFGSAYNASKAALHAYGDTLRIELEPFGIKVVTIVTGAVKSQIGAKNPTEMPENSYYSLMRDLFIEKRVKRPQQVASPTDLYASTVVAKTLKKSPAAWIWVGHGATMVKLLYTFGWTTIWDVFLDKYFGLDIFKKRLVAQRSKQ